MDDNVPIGAVQAHFFGEFGVRADADRHHHEVSGHFAAVLEFDGGDAAIRAAHQLLGLRAHQEGQAAVFQRFLQQLSHAYSTLANTMILMSRVC